MLVHRRCPLPLFLSPFRVGPGLPGASRACSGRGAGGSVGLERERAEGTGCAPFVRVWLKKQNGARSTKIPRPTGGARCNHPPLQSKLAWAEAVAATARRRAIACRMVGVWREARTLGGVRTVVLFFKMVCARKHAQSNRPFFYLAGHFCQARPSPTSHGPPPPPPTTGHLFSSSLNSRTKIGHASRICRSRPYSPSTDPHHAGADAGASSAPAHSSAELLCVTW